VGGKNSSLLAVRHIKSGGLWLALRGAGPYWAWPRRAGPAPRLSPTPPTSAAVRHQTFMRAWLRFYINFGN